MADTRYFQGIQCLHLKLITVQDLSSMLTFVFALSRFKWSPNLRKFQTFSSQYLMKCGRLQDVPNIVL